MESEGSEIGPWHDTAQLFDPVFTSWYWPLLLGLAAALMLIVRGRPLQLATVWLRHQIIALIAKLSGKSSKPARSIETRRNVRRRIRPAQNR